MNDPVSVLIGIQARSTSTRFPNKVFQTLGNKTILQHVIDGCTSASNYINKYSFKTMVSTKVCLLIPEGDEIGNAYRWGPTVIEGPEHDVLKRYRVALERHNPDYIVRITADCPLIPPYIITKHIKVGTINQYDYLSNVDENSRTVVDGFDCEFMSASALRWLDEKATDQRDREHVTTLIRRNPDPTLKIGQFIGFIDQSMIKLSIDTEEDLQRVRDHYDSVNSKVEMAKLLLGQTAVHRI